MIQEFIESKGIFIGAAILGIMIGSNVVSTLFITAGLCIFAIGLAFRIKNGRMSSSFL